ncbi:MAG TPA: DUF99 family protein [Gammaproteobacteria bacterium]|nr:DUF99 family protein [Gammaproteobacteria bacterium]
MQRCPSYVIGVDDAPFDRARRGNVPVVGAVFNGARLEGVLKTTVRRDGANATRQLERLIGESRFASSLQAVLLQGVTLAGFNVVDVPALHAALGLPVVVVCRREPDLERIRRALLRSVPGGRRKWALIERLPPARACRGVYVQSVGLDSETTAKLLDRFATSSRLPEPVRTAHLIAAAYAEGESRHRA